MNKKEKIQLNIKNFALIQELSVEFGNGFNILSGETGAGKSILIDTIDYVLGGETYRESEDIISNVQHHEVGVCFCFENSNFYFVHDTSIKDRVFKADENFNKLTHLLHIKEDTQTLTIKNIEEVYKQVLENMDGLSLPNPDKPIYNLINEQMKEVILC